MKRILIIFILILASVNVLGIANAQSDEEVIKLQFATPAWQPSCIETLKDIINEWNKKNEKIKVEYIQVDWGSIHDYLITAFETGEAPDIFHYASYGVLEFGNRGYVENVFPLLSEELKKDLHPVALETITKNGEVWGIPILWEGDITVYNKEIFKEEGIDIPTSENPWNFEDLRAAAKKLTTIRDDGSVERWGMGVGMMVTVLTTWGPKFNADFLYETEDGKWEFKIQENEKRLIKYLYEIYNEDKVISHENLSLHAHEILPDFYKGNVAMIPNIGVWIRENIVSAAPEDFKWGVLPPLKDKTQNCDARTQVLGIPAASETKEEAMKFIEFLVDRDNLARIAYSDWLFPTRKSSLQSEILQTDEYYWKDCLDTAEHMTVTTLSRSGYSVEIVNRVLNPIMQDLLNDKISLQKAIENMEQQAEFVLQR